MDFLIQNGMLYDPAAGTLQKGDLAIVDERLATPQPGHSYRQAIDASGCIVLPGLIDYHVHYFNHGTENGIAPDANSFCCGITTVVDGGSCGVGALELYRRTVMSMSEVRILNALLVSSGGQATDRYSENPDPALYDADGIRKAFAQQQGDLVALKLRLSCNILSPDMARAALKRTTELARELSTRVVVHVTDAPLPLDEIAAALAAGDVICHIYHGRGEHTCLDASGHVLPGLWEARRRGVLFDASNGRSNYDLEVCRAALAEGFFPDVISSDNNSSSAFLQPLHSLPRILSKFLDMGMSLTQVLDAATIAPARLIGRPELGTLALGTPADVCILRLEQKPLHYEDINGHAMQGTQLLAPLMTFKGGKCLYCRTDFC